MKKIKQLITIAMSMIVFPFFYLSNKKRKIILVGGHEGQLFADNGKVLYEYLNTNQTEYEIFWIINPDSKDFERVAYQFINRGSMKNYLYYRLAQGAFFSHSASDVGPVMHQLSFVHQPIKVNLEHGVTGFKKAKLNGNSDNTVDVAQFGPVADIFLACSEFEKSIKEEYWHIPSEKIHNTGYARFDKLIPQKEYRKEIIYLPTWREWLVDLSEEEFIKSDFYQSIEKLISDPAFNELLKERDYTLKIYIHFYFHKFISNFSYNTERIEFLPVETDIQEYIINSEVMITDYSSVAWDFFYLSKPVIFYQPDVETYLDIRGSYVDFSKDLFGPQVLTVEELKQSLVSTLEKNREDDSQKELQSYYFTHHDTHNSQRIFEAFKEVEKQK